MNAINPIVLPGKSFDLNTFTYNGITLRTVLIDGKPWFVAADVSRALDQRVKNFVSNLRRSASTTDFRVLCRRDVCNDPQLEGHLFQETKGAVALIDEAALYVAIMRAQRSNPAAREFQDWVTKEVLPRIRRDGAYIMGEEKVATGEVSEDDLGPLIGQAMAKKFNALMDEINARNRVKDSYKAAKQTLCDSNESHRAAILTNEKEIEVIHEKVDAVDAEINRLQWQKAQFEQLKMLLKKIADPGSYSG